MYPVTFLAMTIASGRLQRLHLEKIELHGGLASEDRDHHLELALVGIDFVHDAREVTERTVHDLDRVTHVEGDLVDRLVLGLAHAPEDTIDLLLAQGLGLVARTHEAGDAGD